jgi:diguanylate cyclase (GGDEF)-like protein/PAS domain S-box-containing protein
VHPDDRADWERAIEQARAGDVTETEYRIMGPDGSQRWLLGRRSGTTGPDGRDRVHSTVQDITDRRAAETAAAQLARDNELILSSTEQGIFRIAVDGRITFVNAAAEDMLGYAPGALVGKHAHDEMHHSHPDGSLYPVRDCPIYGALRDGRPGRVSGEHFWRADGTSFPVDYASAPILEGDELVGAVIVFSDISERVGMERAMRDAEERFRHSFDRAPIGIALVSLQGRFQRVNAALCDLTGYPEQELLSLRFQDITHIDDLEAAEGYMSELIAGERSAYEMEKRCLHADGHVIGIQMNGTLVCDADGTQQYVIAQVQDISRRKELEQQMQEAARRDPLTGLYNRRGFTDEFQRTLAYAYRYDRSGAVLMIDLDGFKDVNDGLGHKTGDELLSGIAQRLRDRLRQSDLIGRLGGDEFAVVLAEVSVAEATRVGDDIRQLVRRHGRAVSGDEHGATASVGVAPFDGPAGQEELLNRADQAMYQAKQDGGDRVQLATAAPVSA